MTSCLRATRSYENIQNKSIVLMELLHSAYGQNCSFNNSDFLELQEISTLSCTRFLAIFFWFEGIQTWSMAQESMQSFPFGPRYNTLGAGSIPIHTKKVTSRAKKMLSNNNSTHIYVDKTSCYLFIYTLDIYIRYMYLNSQQDIYFVYYCQQFGEFYHNLYIRYMYLNSQQDIYFVYYCQQFDEFYHNLCHKMCIICVIVH